MPPSPQRSRVSEFRYASSSILIQARSPKTGDRLTKGLSFATTLKEFHVNRPYDRRRRRILKSWIFFPDLRCDVRCFSWKDLLASFSLLIERYWIKDGANKSREMRCVAPAQPIHRVSFISSETRYQRTKCYPRTRLLHWYSCHARRSTCPRRCPCLPKFWQSHNNIPLKHSCDFNGGRLQQTVCHILESLITLHLVEVQPECLLLPSDSCARNTDINVKYR